MITLQIEGTQENSFLPGTRVRIGGKVTERIGTSWLGFDAPVFTQPAHFIDLSVGGEFLESLNTNLAGNYWADITLPLDSGSYILAVDTGNWGYGNASLLVIITSVTTPSSLGLTLDSLNPVVGQTVRASVLVTINGQRVPGVPVNFVLWSLGGNSLVRTNSTDNRGIAVENFLMSRAGPHSLLASSAQIDKEAEVIFEVHAPVVIIDPETGQPVEEPVPEVPTGQSGELAFRFNPLMLALAGGILVIVGRKKGKS